jgi:Homeodomain
MVNPPREEIRKIRIQLQQYGQVGDANVFYWFQNRKSRTKNKHRHLLSSRANTCLSTGGTNTNVIPTTGIPTPHIGVLANVNPSSKSNSMTTPSTNITMPIIMTPQTSSSSSSERSSGSSKPLKPVHVQMSVPEPVNMYNNFHGTMELSSLPDPCLFQNQNGYCFAIPEFTGLITAPADQDTSVGLGLWNEPMGNSGAATGDEEVGVKRKNNADELHHGFGLTNEFANHEAYKGFLARDNNRGEIVKIGLHHDCCFQPTDLVVASCAAESVVTATIPCATGAADVTCAATTVVSCPVNVIQGTWIY